MKKVISICFLLLFFDPTHVGAVEFSIETTEINAQLLNDGDVDVTETHTYEFDGDFNGITRTLIPKEDTTITNFRSTENGENLKVKKKENLYKIYRGGTDETITIDLHYTITQGVQRFEDIAQFYYSFFDENNEATYENMRIRVIPPEITEIKAAYGYDEAYQSVESVEEGAVVFHLGEVPSGEDGSIRVAYDASLFSEMALTSEKPMLNEMLADQEKMEASIKSRLESRERWGNIAPGIVGALVLTAGGLIIQSIRRRKQTGLEIERQLKGNGRFPDTQMSLPATILFTAGRLNPSAIMAALLELVRKEKIGKLSDKAFQLKSRETDFDHEKILIEWLFDDIALEHTFHIDDLEKYVDDKKNHEKYQRSFSAWREAVRNEYKRYLLTEKAVKTRWISGTAGLISISSIILFALNGLILWMIAMILLSLFFLIFAIAYRPLNETGRRLMKSLKPLKKSDQWKSWDKNDQVQGLLYQIGAGKRNMFNSSNLETSQNSEWMSYFLLAATFHSGFEKADQHTTISAATTSGGSGAGGGGGGSGAF